MFYLIIGMLIVLAIVVISTKIWIFIMAALAKMLGIAFMVKLVARRFLGKNNSSM